MHRIIDSFPWILNEKLLIVLLVTRCDDKKNFLKGFDLIFLIQTNVQLKEQ